MKVPVKFGRALFMLMWPGLFVYLRLSHRARVLVVCNDEILLIHSVMGNEDWGLPGGGIGRREQPAAGALRELREEVGITAQPEELKQLASEWVTSYGLSYFCHYHALQVPKKPALNLQKYEVAEARWVPRADALHLGVRTDVKRALELWDKR